MAEKKFPQTSKVVPARNEGMGDVEEKPLSNSYSIAEVQGVEKTMINIGKELWKNCNQGLM